VLGLVQDLVTLISPLNGEVFIRFTSGADNATALPVTASSEWLLQHTTLHMGLGLGLMTMVAAFGVTQQ
jgi:hypothetical protein